MKTIFVLAASLLALTAHATDIKRSSMGLTMYEADTGADFGIDALWVDTAPGSITLIVKRPDSGATSYGAGSSSSATGAAMLGAMNNEGGTKARPGLQMIELDRPLARKLFSGPVTRIELNHEGAPAAWLTDQETLTTMAANITAWLATLPARKAPSAIAEEPDDHKAVLRAVHGSRATIAVEALDLLDPPPFPN